MLHAAAYEAIMRYALLFCLSFATLAGSGPRCSFCCLSAIAANQMPPKNQAQSANSKGCRCCHGEEPLPSSPAPANPARLPCPCQDPASPFHVMTNRVLFDRSVTAGTDSLLCMVWIVVDFEAASSRAFHMPGDSYENQSFPRTTGVEILRALHVSLC